MLQTNLIAKESLLPNQFKCLAIEPVPPEIKRPTWSVMIPTYNRIEYLEQTLCSILQQAPCAEEMQIEVIDNCSTRTDPRVIIDKIGKGRISFYRQPENISLTANWNTCIKKARGKLIHILHDDDLVLPGFYSRLEKAFEQEPTIGAAFCRHADVDENNTRRYLSKLQKTTPGVLPNWLQRIAVEQLIQPPAIVVKRDIYEQLGGFNCEFLHCIDWEMWKRIAAHYPVWYEPEVLAYYRVHANSDTRNIIKSGQNIVDVRRAIEFSKTYIPKQFVNQLSKKASENFALGGLEIARRSLSRGDTVTATNQIQEALKCNSSFKVIITLSLLPIMAVITAIKKQIFK